MSLMVVLGFIAWLVPTVAGVWYLVTFKEMRDELRTIRRYLQALYDKQDGK